MLISSKNTPPNWQIKLVIMSRKSFPTSIQTFTCFSCHKRLHFSWLNTVFLYLNNVYISKTSNIDAQSLLLQFFFIIYYLCGVGGETNLERFCDSFQVKYNYLKPCNRMILYSVPRYWFGSEMSYKWGCAYTPNMELMSCE